MLSFNNVFSQHSATNSTCKQLPNATSACEGIVLSHNIMCYIVVLSHNIMCYISCIIIPTVFLPANGSALSAPQNITCRDQFSLINGICLARCDSWEQSSHKDTAVVLASLNSVPVVGIIGAIAVFAIAIYRRNAM